MNRILPSAVLAIASLPAGTAWSQGAEPPPGQRSIMTVRVGATHGHVPCHLRTSTTLIAPGRPWQPGDRPPIHGDPPPPSDCRGITPIRLKRARHLTITLLGQAPKVGATWHAGGTSTPLNVRPVGTPPTAIWFLRLPVTSGKLVVNLWFPVEINSLGAVLQGRSDYKVSIRRTATVKGPAPEEAPQKTGPPASEPTVTFDGSGR
jgi:hypothetical protein